MFLDREIPQPRNSVAGKRNNLKCYREDSNRGLGKLPHSLSDIKWARDFPPVIRLLEKAKLIH